jgi:tRNA A37 threonylcarbamoyladenosine modification protein TsaB
MDAFRHDVFSARFEVPEAADLDLIVAEEASVEPPAAVWARWAGQPVTVVAGDGAIRYREVIGGGAEAIEPPSLAAAIARIARRRWRRGQTLQPGAVQPLYVRRPDAEVAREAKAAGA